MNQADWCYLSGQVVVAESRLLGHETLVEFLRADSIAPVISRLRQNPMYRSLGELESHEELSGRIESAMVQELRELGNASPDSAPTDLLLSAYDHQQVRNFIKARVHKHDFVPTALSDLTEDQLQSAWDDLVEAPEQWTQLCKTVRAELAAGGDPNTVIDLIIDRAELSCLVQLAQATGSELIGQCYTEYAAQRTRLALLRAKLAELEPEQLRRLAQGLLSDDELNEFIDLPDERLTAKLTAGKSTGETSEQLTRFALEVDNQMTAAVREARGTIFGPERIFGYAWGLSMECLNLKLIGETKLLEAPSEMTEWRLRSTYV